MDDKVTGSNGGRVSGGGLVVNYDTRNSLFYPTQGWLVEGQLYTEGEYSGSDFDYQKMRGYFEGTYRDENLLMIQSEYRFPLFWRLGKRFK